MTTDSADDNNGAVVLLSAVQRLATAERNLTQTLSTTSRYLPTSTQPLLLPTPTTLSQVDTVLALSRTYADRTSAPSGWNPMVPIHGFVTPNPLPHQLRGGQLAALQLKQAQEDREAKRKAVREERERKKKKAEEEEEEKQRLQQRKRRRGEKDHDGDVDMEDATEGEDNAPPVDPKRRELDVMHEKEDRVGREEGDESEEARKRRQQQQQQAQRERAARAAAAAANSSASRRDVPATMNLSESSSSEEEDDDDDDDDDDSDNQQ